MSNSPLVDYTQLSPHYTPNRRHKIDTITIHCTAGQCSVESLGNLFQNKESSSNYGIGKDGRIALYVNECDRAWTTGGYDKNGNPILVNGISGSDNDHRAITIECASDSDEPYAIYDKVYKSLILLCADICRRNNISELKWKANKSLVGNIDQQNMTVHRWFAYKACPGDYIYNRLGQIANEVNRLLRPEEEDIPVDVTEFKKLWLEMRKELQDNDASSYSKEAREWAVSSGIIKGGDTSSFNGLWEDVLTREQLITVLYRFAKYIGKA